MVDSGRASMSEETQSAATDDPEDGDVHHRPTQVRAAEPDLLRAIRNAKHLWDRPDTNPSSGVLPTPSRAAAASTDAEAEITRVRPEDALLAMNDMGMDTDAAPAGSAKPRSLPPRAASNRPQAPSSAPPQPAARPPQPLRVPPATDEALAVPPLPSAPKVVAAEMSAPPISTSLRKGMPSGSHRAANAPRASRPSSSSVITHSTAIRRLPRGLKIVITVEALGFATLFLAALAWFLLHK